MYLWNKWDLVWKGHFDTAEDFKGISNDIQNYLIYTVKEVVDDAILQEINYFEIHVNINGIKLNLFNFFYEN